VSFEYYEAASAVENANSLVRDQLNILVGRHDELDGMLKGRETDRYQLRILVDDLMYIQHSGDSLPPGMTRWANQLHELQQKEQELEQTIDQLRKTLSYLSSVISAMSSATASGGSFEATIVGRKLQGQESERSRLAREVHDGPAQVLANGIMALEYCERLLEKRPAAVPDELSRIKTTMTEGLDEVRRFIFDLRPSSLEHEGLKITLETYTRDYEHRFSIPVALHCDEVDGTTTAEQRFVAFRVIQEALQNCRKHAVATALQIDVRRLDDGVEVSVRDNGRGFDHEASRFRDGHFGVQGMRERAESVRGAVVVFSEPGYGTEVRLWTPAA